MQLLNEWISQNSHSLNPDGLAKMTKLLQASFSRLPAEGTVIRLEPYTDLEGREIKPGPALHYRWNPKGRKHQVFLGGHMDTVYPVHHPFQKADQPGGDRLRGPGAADMKGGLYIILRALEAFHQLPEADQVGYDLLITADEEIGSLASRPLIERIALKCDSGLVFESALPGGELVRNRKGNGSFRFTVQGRSAHTGRDFDKGRNAIAALARLIEQLHSLNHKLPDTIVNVGRVEGGGPLNVVPDQASVFLNIRIPDSGAQQEASTALKNLAATFPQDAGYKLTMMGDFTRPPSVQSPKSEALYERYGKVAESLGFIRPGLRDTGGGSDGNFLTAIGLPFLDGVGAIGGEIHSPEEYIFPSRLSEKIRLTTGYLQSLAS